MADFTLTQGDRLPILEAVLKDALGNVVNLSGATVRFGMRPSFRTRSTAAALDAPATLVSASLGLVSYAWQAGDTDVQGLFEGRFKVTFADGRTERFPNGTPLQIHVTAP